MQRISRLASQLFSRTPVVQKAPVKKPLLDITDNSTRQIHQMLCMNPAAGILLGMKRRGCNGNSFVMSFAAAIESSHEVIEKNGVNILVDKKDLLRVIGTKIDYVETPVQSGFVFSNPNATGACGCGESFSLDEAAQDSPRVCARQ